MSGEVTVAPSVSCESPNTKVPAVILLSCAFERAKPKNTGPDCPSTMAPYSGSVGVRPELKTPPTGIVVIETVPFSALIEFDPDRLSVEISRETAELLVLRVKPPLSKLLASIIIPELPKILPFNVI